MANFGIRDVGALEILDSRARPTLAVTLTLSDGTVAVAGVPSGASTGSREAVELRDGDASRFSGQGVLTAVGNVNGEIADMLRSRQWSGLEEVDAAMRELDGTPTKSRLGANAIVGVSMALARALALAGEATLYGWLTPAGVTPRLPVPHFNVVNGGVHAPNPLEMQEFMLAPIGSPNIAEAVRAGAEIYARLKKRLAEHGHATGLGDEGGFAPDLSTPEEVLEELTAAITDAGYRTGKDGVAIAMDPASSEFLGDDGRYTVGGKPHTSDELIERYAALVDRFPLWSIEDGLAENDWDGWARLTERLGDRIQLVGDDIFVTNPEIIAKAIEQGIGNSALIKLNQIGSVSETLDAMALCRRSGYTQMVSHRSGETEDSFIADLAVGTGCGQIKTGAPARGERVAKYNRLMAIAAERTALDYGLTD